MISTAPISPNLPVILRLLEHAKVTVFAQDADLRYRWIENAPDAWNVSDIRGKTDIDVLPGRAAALASSAKRDVLQNARPRWSELTVETTSQTQYFDFYVEPDRDSSGMIIGVVGIAINASNRRKQAATMELVARDLSHQVKNLLAVIQSLGTQTARTAASTDAFIEDFRGRIQSISRSQDLSIGAKAHGARLSELLETQVTPYLTDIDRQLDFDGEDRHLTPNGALHIGLAFRELCTSAVRSGALSGRDGKITVSATFAGMSGNGPARHLELTWLESGGARGHSLESFSKVLLERIVPAAVGGRATLAEMSTGRRYTVSIAAEEFE